MIDAQGGFMITRSKVVLVVGAAAGAAGILVACGGSTSNVSGASGADGGPDATVTGEGGISGEGGSQSEAATQGGGADGSSDAGATGCAAPSVPTNAAVCVTVSPEAIAFLSDPNFDGKGLLTVGVYSNAHPSDDAGLAPAVLLPSQDAGAGDAGLALIDLSQPVPAVRFEVPATTAYVRAIFIDNPASFNGGLQAGWWVGGLDLSQGLANAPLMPLTLTAGTATNVTIDLIALRQLTLTVSRDPGLTAPGNGQGPLKAIAVNTTLLQDAGTYFFGVAQNPCANVSGDAAATVPGWVVLNGPYWVAATLDEFDAGGSFPAGGLFSLEVDAGVPFIPSIDEISYDASAYQVTGSVVLTYANPWDGGADADIVSCP
jgi:hypothetical protein